MLTVDGKVVDVTKYTTGFRKPSSRRCRHRRRLYQRQVRLPQGFSERTADEWAGVGAGYPEWMHDFTAQMIRDDHANYMRWMHVTPQKEDVESYDAWVSSKSLRPPTKKRTAWAASGTSAPRLCATPSSTCVTTQHSLLEPATPALPARRWSRWLPCAKSLIPTVAASWDAAPSASRSRRRRRVVGHHARRPYNNDIRDREPIIETEDFRDEGARRFWDNYSRHTTASRKARPTPGTTTPKPSPSPRSSATGCSIRTASLTPTPNTPSSPPTPPSTSPTRTRRPPGHQRSRSRQRQGRRRPPAQGNLLCRARYAEREA